MKWPSTSGHPGLSSEAGAVEGTGEKDGWGGVASILGLALPWTGSGKDAEGQNLGSGAPQRGRHGGQESKWHGHARPEEQDHCASSVKDQAHGEDGKVMLCKCSSKTASCVTVSKLLPNTLSYETGETRCKLREALDSSLPHMPFLSFPSVGGTRNESLSD